MNTQQATDTVRIENKAQLKKLLKAAGVEACEITGAGSSLQIEVSADDANRLRSAGLSWVGYRTGYGAWVLRASYVGSGDYMSKSYAWRLRTRWLRRPAARS